MYLLLFVKNFYQPRYISRNLHGVYPSTYRTRPLIGYCRSAELQ